MFKLRRIKKAAMKYDYCINYDPEIIKDIIPDCIEDMETLQELTDEYIAEQNNNLQKVYEKYNIYCFIYSADTLSQSFLFLYSNFIIFILFRVYFNLQVAKSYKNLFSRFKTRLYQFKYFHS